jgi:hypothetical protein
MSWRGMWLEIERDVVWRSRHTAGAGIVLVVMVVPIALGAGPTGSPQDQMTAQRIIINDWPALAGACIAPTVQRLPDGKLHAWCRDLRHDPSHR